MHLYLGLFELRLSCRGGLVAFDGCYFVALKAASISGFKAKCFGLFLNKYARVEEPNVFMNKSAVINHRTIEVTDVLNCFKLIVELLTSLLKTITN